MAAGKITKAVTYSTGNTLALQFWVDDTVTPTVANQINMLADLAGNLATIKPASTAAVATDPAIVVALSPNGLNNNGQALSINSEPSVLASDQVWASAAHSAAVSVTRTADTNAYLANDVLGAATGSTAALTFATMGQSAGRVMITSASLEFDRTTVISGEANYRLYLYNVTPPSAVGDNGAWDLPSGDRASFLGYIDLGTPVDLGSTAYVEVNNINKQIKLSGTSIFAYLVTIGPYTPASATVHLVTLHTVEV